MYLTGNKFRGSVKTNTSGGCLICLKQVEFFKSEGWSDRSGVVDRSKISELLHYLNLSVEDSIFKRNLTGDTNNGSGRSSSSVAAELCESCEKLTERISKLISIKKAAEMEISYHLGSIHQKISESGKMPGKMGRYQGVLKRNGGDNGSSSVMEMDDLREKLSSKCSQSALLYQPRVIVNRISLDWEQISNLWSTVHGSGVAAALNPDSVPTVDTFLPKMEIKTEGEESLQEPEIETNAESSSNYCNICQKSFVALNSHMWMIHGKRKRKCPHCSRVFPQISKLYSSHVQRCSTSKIPGIGQGPSKRCEICSKVYATTFSLAVHFRKTHPHVKHQTNINLREHKCEICGKVFFAKRHLNIHQTSAHFGVRHHCSFPGCLREYSTQESLIFHWRRKHGNLLGDKRKQQWCDSNKETKKQRSCDICFKTFGTLYNLKRHRHQIHSPSFQKCTFCEKEFSNAENLKTHIDQVHLSNAGEFLDCKVEGLNFRETSK